MEGWAYPLALLCVVWGEASCGLRLWSSGCPERRRTRSSRAECSLPEAPVLPGHRSATSFAPQVTLSAVDAPAPLSQTPWSPSTTGSLTPRFPKTTVSLTSRSPSASVSDDLVPHHHRLSAPSRSPLGGADTEPDVVTRPAGHSLLRGGHCCEPARGAVAWDPLLVGRPSETPGAHPLPGAHEELRPPR